MVVTTYGSEADSLRAVAAQLGILSLVPELRGAVVEGVAQPQSGVSDEDDAERSGVGRWVRSQRRSACFRADRRRIGAFDRLRAAAQRRAPHGSKWSCCALDASRAQRLPALAGSCRTATDGSQRMFRTAPERRPTARRRARAERLRIPRIGAIVNPSRASSSTTEPKWPGPPSGRGRRSLRV